MRPSLAWVTVFGKKNNSRSVKLETVPKNHFTTASVTTPGRMMISPVKKLVRERAKSDFFTR